MQANRIVTLQNGPLRMVVAPAIGGAIAGFWRDGVALMRETPGAVLREGIVRQMSSYPLVPYSNRIAHGRFSFDGVEHDLAPNFGDHPHSIHGNAWQRPWCVTDVTGTACRLDFAHRPVGEEARRWPFAYRAEQAIELDPESAVVTLRLTNEDTRPMPTGFGLHPFFPRRSDTTLRFFAWSVWRNGEDVLPRSRDAVLNEWNYREGRALGEPGLDNCFAGWNGIAEIGFPDDDILLTIEADPVFGHLVVYVPPGRDFFAIEPVSHMNDAVNRPAITDNGLKILQPGETLRGTVRFRVERGNRKPVSGQN